MSFQEKCKLIAESDKSLYNYYNPESNPIDDHYSNGPPFLCSYTQIKVPFHILPMDKPNNTERYGVEDFVPLIIGKNGKHLKWITETSGIHYIWYNKNPLSLQDNIVTRDAVFQLWGQEHLLSYAVALLQTHITSIGKYINFRFLLQPEPKPEPKPERPNLHVNTKGEILTISEYIAEWDSRLLQFIINEECDKLNYNNITHNKITHNNTTVLIDFIENNLFNDLKHDLVVIHCILDQYKRRFLALYDGYHSDSSEEPPYMCKDWDKIDKVV